MRADAGAVAFAFHILADTDHRLNDNLRLLAFVLKR
jgi:hypothetical protein